MPGTFALESGSGLLLEDGSGLLLEAGVGGTTPGPIPPLAPNQMEIGAGGLTIGPGTAFQWVDSGPQWFTAAPVRTNDMDRQSANGTVAGFDFLGKHTATLQVSILGDSDSDLADKIDAWKAACTVRTDTLVQLRSSFLGRARVRYGRFRRGGDVDASMAAKGHTAIGSAQFETLDALTYGDAVNSSTTARRGPSTGITFPITFPINFGSALSTGGLTAVNGGNAPAPWVAVLVGPLANMFISHTESGRYLLLTANGGINLAPGEILVLDSRTHGVLMHGTANFGPRLAFESHWWDLAPGANTITLAAASGTGTVTVQWRDTWWS